MSENLTELLSVRITKRMSDALEQKARYLGLRVQDIVRVRLGEYIFNEPRTLIDSPVDYVTEEAQ